MHSKDKGSIGQLKVAADLISKGYSVFTELGDNCATDLILLDKKTYKTYKIQVKYREVKNGVVKIETQSSGPNYKTKYSLDNADIFAIFVPIKDIILYVSAPEFLSKNALLTIRFEPTRNCQKLNCNFAEDFLEIKGLIT